MNKVASSPMVRTFPLLVVLAVSLLGCSQSQSSVTFSYTLPIVPITFSLDSSGNISVSAAATLVTELGEFAVEASSPISAVSVPTNSLMLTIRHKVNGNLVDTVYQINTGVVGSADIQGNISEVKIGWNGQNNTIFVDASNGDITNITIQGDATNTTTNDGSTTSSDGSNSTSNNNSAPPAAFQCPGTDQVSAWMNTSVSRVSTSTDNCAFHAGDVQGQTLTGVICTNQDGGTTIEYNTVDHPTTLIIKDCDGNQLPEIYGFTIRFVQGYPSSGPWSASVCAVAAQAPAHLPAGWTVQPEGNC